MKKLELELKHLAPYLPYGLKVQNRITKKIVTCRGIFDIPLLTVIYDDHETITHKLNGDNRIVPILKPLFAIPQELVDMSPYNNHDELIESIEEQTCPHNIFRSAIANHFDVFGLIEQGLAVDINTL